MAAGNVEFVDITPLGDGPYTSEAGESHGPSWHLPGPRIWIAAALLVAAAVMALLTARGEAWTSVTTTGQGRSVRTNLAGSVVVTEFDLPVQIVTTRVDEWGQSTTTTVVADSGNPGLEMSGHAAKFGLGFVIGAAGIAVAAALTASAQRWRGLARPARAAAIAAAALLAGIWVASLITVIGAGDALVAAGPSGTPALDRHSFHVGDGIYLGLAAAVLAAAAAVLVNVGSEAHWPTGT